MLENNCVQIEMEYNDLASKYIAENIEKLVKQTRAMSANIGRIISEDEAMEIVNDGYCRLRAKELRGKCYDINIGVEKGVPVAGYVIKTLQGIIYTYINKRRTQTSEMSEDTERLQSIYATSAKAVDITDEIGRAELDIDIEESLDYILSYNDARTNKKIRNILLNIDTIGMENISKNSVFSFVRDICDQHDEFKEALMNIFEVLNYNKEKVTEIVSRY